MSQLKRREQIRPSSPLSGGGLGGAPHIREHSPASFRPPLEVLTASGDTRTRTARECSTSQPASPSAAGKTHEIDHHEAPTLTLSQNTMSPEAVSHRFQRPHVCPALPLLGVGTQQ